MVRRTPARRQGRAVLPLNGHKSHTQAKQLVYSTRAARSRNAQPGYWVSLRRARCYSARIGTNYSSVI